MCQVLRLQKTSNIDCNRKGILSFFERKNFEQKVFISINLSFHGDSAPLLTLSARNSLVLLISAPLLDQRIIANA